MPLSESELVSRLKATLRAQGCMVVKGLFPWDRGMPDLIVIWPDGRVHWVEVKREGEQAAAMQRFQMRELARRDQAVYIVEGEEGVRLYIDGKLRRVK